MILEQVAETDPLLLGHEIRQVDLNLIGIGVVCQAQPLGEPHHVGIDPDGILTEGVAEDDVGCFSTHPGQRGLLVDVLRDFASKPLDNFPAAILDHSGLVPVEVDFADCLFQLFQRGASIVFGGAEVWKNLGRYLINQIIPDLGCKDERDKELQWIRKVEIELGFGVGSI